MGVGKIGLEAKRLSIACLSLFQLAPARLDDAEIEVRLGMVRDAANCLANVFHR